MYLAVSDVDGFQGTTALVLWEQGSGYFTFVPFCRSSHPENLVISCICAPIETIQNYFPNSAWAGLIFGGGHSLLLLKSPVGLHRTHRMLIYRTHV